MQIVYFFLILVLTAILFIEAEMFSYLKKGSTEHNNYEV